MINNALCRFPNRCVIFRNDSEEVLWFRFCARVNGVDSRANAIAFVTPEINDSFVNVIKTPDSLFFSSRVVHEQNRPTCRQAATR